MRVLVTGLTGFVGPWLMRALGAAGHEVHGLVRDPGAGSRLDNVGVPPEALHRADLSEAGVAAVVRDVAPGAIVHLAALSFVPDAERDPAATYATNVGGTLALLAAVRAHAREARVLVVTSGDVYGAVRPEDLPVVEETPLRPLTVYGASKAAADLAAGQWARAYGLPIVRARPFNHTGPGQSASFVCSAIARQVARIEAGRQEPVLRVGNVDPVRDFSDVRDVAAAYVALLERGRAGEAYNVCSGEGVSVAEIIAITRDRARVPMRVHSDPALRRPNDVPRVVGSPARLTAETGWRPRIPLVETIGALLADWRARIAAEG